MNLIGSVLVCAVVSGAAAGWLQELVSPRGLEVGSGFVLHLDRAAGGQGEDEGKGGGGHYNESARNGSSFLERHALRLDYDGYGLTVGKKAGRDAIEVGFYENENGEGRGKKMGDMIVPIMMGFKMTGLVTFTFTLVAAFVIKALGVAKLALISASIVTLLKLITPDPHQQQHHAPIIEVDPAGSEHYAMVSGTGEDMGYHPSASANVYAYNNNIIPPSAIASETAMHYATVDAPVTNSSAVMAPVVQQAAVVGRRRDFSKRKLKKPIVTIHRYSIET